MSAIETFIPEETVIQTQLLVNATQQTEAITTQVSAPDSTPISEQASYLTNDLTNDLTNKVSDLSIQSTSVIPSELTESNLGEVNPNYPNLFHNYYDMEYINTGIVNNNFNASSTIGQPRWNRLPIVKVSNKVLFASQTDVVNYIVDKASSNIRAIYWTDLFRRPSDIPYHIGAENFNYQYQITNNQITGCIISGVSNPKLNDYINHESVRNAVLPLFTTNNMLNLSISWTDITIRIVPTTNSFVIVESHNNLHEYGHTNQSCYP